MRVILLKDVARLGRKSEIKEVPNGHATNFLIPRGLAIIATPDSLRRVEEVVKKHAEHKQHDLDVFKTALTNLEGKTIVYATEANEKGSLFKGVSSDDIARQLKSEHIEITKEQITLAHPLKTTGIHEIPVAYGGLTGVCRLEIIKK